MTGYLTFPYRIDSSGRTATSDLSAYVEALVLLVLQTDPGERVNRPSFGAGLSSLVFAGMDGALAAASETLVRSKLLQFLGEAISIQGLTVVPDRESLRVTLTYVVTRTGQQTTQIVTQAAAGATAPDGRPAAIGRPAARLASS